MSYQIINQYPDIFTPTEGDLQAIETAMADAEDGTIVSYQSAFLFERNEPSAYSEVVANAPRRVLYLRDSKPIGGLNSPTAYPYEVMERKRRKVMVSIPAYSHIESATLKSVWELIVPDDTELLFDYTEGYTVAVARNAAVQKSLDAGADYTLWVDSDVILPHETLLRLLSMEKDIATGYYVKKMNVEPRITELYGADKLMRAEMVNINENELPEDRGVIRILGCGFGCTLVRNDVFRAVGNGNWFEYIYGEGRLTSEDLDFCKKARAKGFEIWADTALRCPHIGKVMF